MRVNTILGVRRSIGRSIGWLAVTMMIAMHPSGVARAGECWDPPVTGTIVDPFRQPECLWCAGNRGIEYEVAPSTRPRAVAAGTVSFSGVVAGQRFVVIDLPGGWKLTYGGLVDSQLRAGDPIVAGTVVGSSSGPFFFGLRIDGVYTDPAPYLGAIVGIPRLVPIDGRASRPSLRVRLECRGGLDTRSR